MRTAAGLDVKNDDFINVKASWSSAFQGFQDRQFDAYINGGIAPFPQVEQLALTSEIRLLGFTEEEYAAHENAQKFNVRTGGELGIIPVGTYSDGVDTRGDVYTTASSVGIIVRADLSDDVVYNLTKTFWNAAEAAKASTPWLSDVTIEYAIADRGMALHPGAARYYQEIGMEIPAGSMPAAN